MLDQFFEEEEANAGEVKSIAVGIDLGTTNTVVAHSNQDGMTVCADSQGRELHPSIISFFTKRKNRRRSRR